MKKEFLYLGNVMGEVIKKPLDGKDSDEMGEYYIEELGFDNYITLKELNNKDFDILKELTIGGYIACWEQLVNGRKEYNISKEEERLYNLIQINQS